MLLSFHFGFLLSKYPRKRRLLWSHPFSKKGCYIIPGKVLPSMSMRYEMYLYLYRPVQYPCLHSPHAPLGVLDFTRDLLPLHQLLSRTLVRLFQGSHYIRKTSGADGTPARHSGPCSRAPIFRGASPDLSI